MSRQVYLLGVGLLVVAAGAVTDGLLAALPGPTEANARRVRAGMTMGEVEALLDGPGRILGRSYKFRCRYDLYEWDAVLVAFDLRGRALSASFHPREQPSLSLPGRLRAWLG
jgi:hypothetical protein